MEQKKSGSTTQRSDEYEALVAEYAAMLRNLGMGPFENDHSDHDNED